MSVQMIRCNCIKPVGRVMGADGEFHDIACKMWNCPHCKKVLLNKLMDKVNLFFNSMKCRFMTLTMLATDPRDIMKFWNILRTDLERNYRGIVGFWGKEFTKAAVRHLHVIVNKYIKWSWLSRRWKEITGTSHVVRMNRAEVRSAAAYMFKYMSKAYNWSVESLYRKGERRYGFFGAKAPKLDLSGFSTRVLNVELGVRYNPMSSEWFDHDEMRRVKGYSVSIKRKGEGFVKVKMGPGNGGLWSEKGFYNVFSESIGPRFIEYMEAITFVGRTVNSGVMNLAIGSFKNHLLQGRLL